MMKEFQTPIKLLLQQLLEDLVRDCVSLVVLREYAIVVCCSDLLIQVS